MATSEKRPIRLLAVTGGAMLLLATAAAQESAPAEPPSPVSPTHAVLLKVVRSQETDPAVRLESARALILDGQAHDALVALLEDDQADNARIILCQALADGYRDHVIVNGHITNPAVFNDPLFNALRAENEELSTWAARALARMYDQNVVARASALVADPAETTASRLAGIRVLVLMPGKASVIALGSLLADPKPQIRLRAVEAVTAMLALPGPIDPYEFRNAYLPQLRAMTEKQFLNRTIADLQTQIIEAQTRIGRQAADFNRLKEQFLRTQTNWLNRFSDPTEKLVILQSYLPATSNDLMRPWAMERLYDLSAVATVQSGPLAGPLAESLTPYISDGDARIRQLTAMVLERLVDNARDAAPALLEQLIKEEDTDTSMALLETLGTFEFTGAIDQALKLLESDNPQVVARAARALGKIAVSNAPPLNDDELDKTALGLTRTNQNWPDALEIRKELIQAMGKIAAVERYRPQARGHFQNILPATLTDADGTVRRWAVRALTELYGSDVFGFLLESEASLLNDSDSGVRLLVIEAVKNHGGRSELALLQRRLDTETDDDVAKAMLNAFVAILQTQSIQEAHEWAQKVQACAQNDAEDDHLLPDQIIKIFWEKIGQKKAASRSVPPEYEHLALVELAEISLRQPQPLQAVAWYNQLLNLEALTPEEKDRYRQSIFALTLSDDANEALLQAGRPAFEQLALGDNGIQTLEAVLQYLAPLDVTDEGQLQRGARLLGMLIVPLPSYPSDELHERCDQKRVEFALAIIDHQVGHLTQDGQDSSEIIDLLQKLDAQLNDYPHDESPDQRIAKLQEYRQILQAAQPASSKQDPNIADKSSPIASSTVEKNI